MAAFVQLIEVKSNRLEEVQSLIDDWVSKTEGKRRAHRGVLTADRDQPDTYLQIVEFPSYEDAIANSELPETDEFAKRLVALCDGPLVFRNLDVRRVDDFG